MALDAHRTASVTPSSEAAAIQAGDFAGDLCASVFRVDNLYTLVSDTFPRQAVGSVVGLGGMAGAVGGMMIAWVTGRILDATGSYVAVFLLAAFAYLTALA